MRRPDCGRHVDSLRKCADVAYRPPYAPDASCRERAAGDRKGVEVFGEVWRRVTYCETDAAGVPTDSRRTAESTASFDLVHADEADDFETCF